MKKFIYTFCAMASALILFTSNSGGYAETAGEGLTGAPGDTKLSNGDAKTCQSCHNGGSFNPKATIDILDEAGANAVTKYEAGKTYTIRVSVNAGAGTPAGYGFQLIDIRKSNDANVKGFLATQANGIQLSSLSNGRVYAEHSARSASKTFDVKWKAPSPSVGTVTFYAVGNAVNGTGGSSGDNGTASVKVDLSELTSGVNELAAQVTMSLSPNPTTEGVVLSLSSKVTKKVTVRFLDISGRTHISENWHIQMGENSKKWDISRLPRGAYMVQVIDNEGVVAKEIVKI
jgi:Secretion system C-terminal sorting domain